MSDGYINATLEVRLINWAPVSDRRVLSYMRVIPIRRNLGPVNKYILPC